MTFCGCFLARSLIVVVILWPWFTARVCHGDLYSPSPVLSQCVVHVLRSVCAGSSSGVDGVALLAQARQIESRAADAGHDLAGFVSQFGATARGPSKWEAAAEVVARELPATLALPAEQAAETLSQLRVGVDRSLKEERTALEGAREELATLDTERAAAQQQATKAWGEKMQVAEVERQDMLAEVSRLGLELNEAMLKGERLERGQKVELRRRADTLAAKTKEIGRTHQQLEENHTNVSELLNTSATAMRGHQHALDTTKVTSVQREKELVQAYVSALQENAEHAQSNLDKKQRQVHEVEFQWAEARNKATEFHDLNETTCSERDQLEELVLKLKVFCQTEVNIDLGWRWRQSTFI